MTIPHITSQHIRKHVTYRHATESLKQALLTDVDPATDFEREILPLHDGKQLLFMPSQSSRWVGSKLISVNPNNTARNKSRVQGLYLLMDADTTTPQVIVDGNELTSVRAAAVSMLVADLVLARDPKRLLMFGYGAQARSHTLALKELRPTMERLVVHGRRPERAEMFAANASEHGWFARTGTAIDPHDATCESDVIVTATGAAEPLFDSEGIRPGTLVIAVGSHNHDHRELDSKLIARSNVVVEDVATAMREAGDIVLAAEEGAITAEQLIPLRDLVRGERKLDPSKPTVLKTVGMSWQDLVVAGEIYERVPATALR
ncbi:ornithine cyclodeaminase family protein [Gulosibacter molinativorax]|uniref:Ornithine cyclodeaminase family protein n=1 Tax=Gulosibacter molinativorax TaxID=256821 RepID=A0ABT7C7V8_9MICO|nr:ornithine cyclodeaminase family protein [Gulosibacter molinativorax]MDJ1371306.1 ornithine cyclodeaminase family protein [Gulosibacter molinativorax]QUY63630.1 Putative ornithine cyclodeaminase, mu-crystallin [Gulosibacter molinativorax]